MDTDFTRQSARGSRLDAQAEITPDEICGCCRRDSTRKPTQPGPGRSRLTLVTATASIWAGALWKSSQPPGTRPTPSLYSIAPTVCFLPVTPTTPRPSGSSGLKPILMLTALPFVAWQAVYRIAAAKGSRPERQLVPVLSCLMETTSRGDKPTAVVMTAIRAAKRLSSDRRW